MGMLLTEQKTKDSNMDWVCFTWQTVTQEEHLELITNLILNNWEVSPNAFREDFFFAALFRRNPADKLSLTSEFKFYYEHEVV